MVNKLENFKYKTNNFIIIKQILLIIYYTKIKMAVPKKRASKSKSNSRKANWKRKAYLSSQKALSLAKSVLTNKNTNFIYINDSAKMDSIS
uniref:Large ribosomal subunit protein bL32c n=1 Tax=Mastocarpus papillatus TaxID=31436 RepID=A0A342RZA1_9FLOR|nr:ribosomal protein L32 [Mastocarpus papillatus]AOL58047.1 ribosomal protein L32 [Mastocarpus papillatus]